MTKQNLTNAVKASLDKGASVEEIIEKTFDVIKAKMEMGESVYLRGFGTFAPKHRAEKKAQNISKGETIIVPAHYVPHWKPSKKFNLK